MKNETQLSDAQSNKQNLNLQRKSRLSGLYAFPAAALLAVFSLSTPAFATEGGTTHYPTDVNTVGSGYAPLPGTLQYLNYTTTQWSHTLANKNGNESVPGFSLNAEVDAARFLYTFKKPIGPFHFVLGGIMTLKHIHIDLGNTSGSVTNIGDVDVETLLSYHTPNHKLFLMYGLDTYAPTGRFKADHLVNAGHNYWSFDPNIDFTYNATKKLSISGQALLEFSTENNATHYQSGHAFNLDYGVNYQAFAGWPKSSFLQHVAFGISGNYFDQFTNDKVNGVKVGSDGYRGEEFSIGPQLVYHWHLGGIAVKYEHDVIAHDRPRINSVWIQFSVPIFGPGAQGGK